MKSTFTPHRLLVATVSGLVAAAAHASLGEIVGITGKGEYRPDNDDKWREARIKTVLEPAWWVRTGAASKMALMVAPQTQVQLDANSTFQLRKEEKAPGTTLNLRQGRAWSQSKQASGSLKMETPSAIAAIHGTDWEMAVDEAGRATLTVLHGTVDFSNSQGAVTVGNGEQALAEPGKAPVKRIIANPAERVQWVSAFRVDPTRYAEYRGTERQEILDLLAKGDWRGAATRLGAQPNPVPADPLLLADLSIHAGDFAAAARLLEQGARQYPQDGRFPAALARLALLKGEGAAALKTARVASEHFPRTSEVWLALGEAARFEGLTDTARTAFARADALAADDGRASLGLGRIAAARADIAPARAYLNEAKRRSPQLPDLAGEQGNLETIANRQDAAQAHFDAALAADPQDYIALTGLAQLRLRQGQDDAALEAVLRANLLEPRHANAYIARAVAHHRRGESATALEFLRQASERDAHDPLPHFMASLIHQDRGELFAAAAAARQAKEKLPFLKSLDPLAMDQKGSANVGSALAKLGLTDWARYYAQEAHDPLWAGSHFFLADQYSGSFNKNSALMQGFLADPLAFGAGNRFQSLLPTPGAYLTLGARMTKSNALRYNEPSVVANGAHYPGFPLAWFFEGLKNDVQPGQQDLAATGEAYTLALGMQPRHDLSLFLFANNYAPEIEYFDEMAQTRKRISGRTSRFDGGGGFRLDPETAIWLKIGDGDYLADVTSLRTGFLRKVDRANRDWQLRTSWRTADKELHFGIEMADSENAGMAHSATSPTYENRHEQDQYRQIYFQGRYTANPQWSFEGGLGWAEYAKDTATRAGPFFVRNEQKHFQEERALPGLGAIWRPAPAVAVRGVWQDWIRSNAPHSLRPPAIAGIPVDDQLTLPGGRQQRLRLQTDWELASTAFVTAFIDAKQVRNLGQAGQVLNTAEEVSDLNRMRDRGLFQNWGDPERLEGQPVFAAGRARQAGATGNAFLGGGFTGNASYLHTVSKNTDPLWAGPLPYLPRHRVGFGLDWSNESRLTAGGWLVWRSERFAAEKQNLLPASWDLTLRLKWESADKRWQVESWATNLLKKVYDGDGGKKNADVTLGLGVQWRY